MALISSASKSGRLLASRRYTHETLTDAQESFTNVLDLQASETYTQAGYLPSSGLPFSGSTQINLSHRVSGSNVLKYWYRHKLTKSNTNNETWFFLNPSGSDNGIGAQLINDNQQVNFVSPKYSTAALATSTTADSTPGYLATLYKSSAVSNSIQTGSLDGDDVVSTNDYIFDYKTGVIQFKNSSLDPTNSEYLYMTVYQYTGTTSATGLDVRGNVTGSDIYSTGTLDIDGATTLNSTLDVDGATTLNGTVTLGNASGDTVNITAATINPSNIAAGTDNTVVVYNGSTLVTDEIDSKVWDGNLVDTDGSGANNELATWSDSDSIIGEGNLTFDGSTLGVTGGITSTGNIITEGDVIAENYIVSSSVSYMTSSFSSGSTIFGDTTDDTHQVTGSLNVTGSITAYGAHSLTSATTIDIDAEGALTLDGGSITIGGDTDVATVIESTTLDVNSSGAITIDGTSTVSIDGADDMNFTITSGTAGEDLTIAQVGANDSSIIITAAGTGTDAISIDATAGDMVIAPTLADGKTLKIGKNGAVEMVFTPHGTAASEKWSLTNTAGTATDSIKIRSIAGGLDIDAQGVISIDSQGGFNLGQTTDQAWDIDTSTLDIDSSDAITIDGTSTIGIGTAANAGNISIGTNGTAREVTIGSNTGDSGITLVTGTGGIDVDAQGDITVDAGTTSAISLDASADSNFTTSAGLLTLNGAAGVQLTGAVTASTHISASGTITSNQYGGNISGSSVSTGSFGYLNVVGDAVIGGNLTFGDAATDNVSFSADVSSSLIPNNDDAFDLGSSGQQWKDLYVDGVAYIDTIGSDGDPTTSAYIAGGEIDATVIGSETAAAITGTTIDATTDFTIGGTVITDNTITDDGTLVIASTTATSFSDGNITNVGSIALDSIAADDGSSFTISNNWTNAGNTIANLGTVSAATSITATDLIGTNIDGILGADTARAITGTTIDATTDFTIDGLVLTADTITNDAGLSIIANGSGDITLDPAGNNVLPGGDSADSLGASGTAWAKLWVDDIDLAGQGSISMGGTAGRIDLDADDDTSIRSAADDVITFEAGAVDIAQMTSTMAISGSSVSTGSLGQLNIASSGSVYIPDSVRVNFGDSNDLKIYHSGNHSIIQDTGTGNLRIKGSIINIQGTSTAEDIAKFTENAGAELYYDDSKKFETSNTGIAITGDMGATISGSSVSTGSFGRLQVIGNTNLTGDITVGGNLTLGDAASDSVSITADLTSHLIPNAGSTYDLGSSSQGWNDLHLSEGGVINWDNGDATLTQASDVVTLAGATLTGTLTNALSITANGGIGMTSYNASAAVSNLSLDIDGMTAIGADLATGDIFAVDDGAGGTNRKVTIDRIADFVSGSAFSKISGDVSITGAGVATVTGAETNAALTAGDGISAGGTFNGAAARTFAIDLSEYSDVQIASGDKFLVLDSNNSTEQLESVDDLAAFISASTFSVISGDVAITGAGVATVTGATTNAALTAGVGLSTTSGTFNGGSAVTFALDLSELSSVDVASGDRLATLDSNGSTEQLTLVDDLADYVSGSAFGKISGDITITGAGVSTIGSDTVANTMLENMAANTVKVRNANSSGDPSDLALATTQILIGDGTGFTVAALSGDVTMTNAGAVSIGATKVTGAMLNDDVISAQTNLGSAGVAQSDEFMFSDAGVLKALTFSYLEDSIFANVSGDAGIGAGGDLSLTVAAITNQTNMTGDVADADELLINDGGALKRADFSVVRDAVFNDVSGDILIADGGGATIQANSVALTTDTTGNYMVDLAAGALIDVTHTPAEGSTGTIAVDLAEAGEAAIANGDYILFLDGGATGTHAKEAVHDLATLFSGTGLTATNSVIAVDASQTQITSVGTIGTGTWEGDTVVVGQGGTGATSFTDGHVLLGSGAGAITALDVTADGAFLVGDGSGDPVAETGNTARTSLGVGTGDSPTFTGLTATGNVAIQGDLIVTGDRVEARVGSLQVEDHTITVGSGSTTSALMNQAGLDLGVSGSVAFLRYDHGTTTLSSSVDLTAAQLHSTIATGTAPLTVSSTTVVSNLNADKLDGQEGSYYTDFSNQTVTSGELTDAMMNDDVAAGLAGTGMTATSGVMNVIGGTGITANANEITTTDGDIVHDNLSGFVANEHINHANVSISSGGILSGGGTIAANRTITLASSDVDHDAATNFVADEHIAHSGVTLTAGTGLSGGGTIAASRTFAVDLNELGTETSIADADFIAMVDATDDGSQKITFENLEDAIFASVSGDIAIAEDGAATIQANAVQTGMVHDDVATELAGAGMTATSGVLNAIGSTGITVNADNITTNDGQIVHDSLSGFVADEHIAHSGVTLTAGTGLNGGGTIAASRTFTVDAAQTVITSIYATDLIMGEDDETNIDFGTVNQISFNTNDAEDFRMVAGGTFHANADVVAYSSTVASDMNLKENITDMKYGLSDIMKLRGVEYDWKREDMGHDVGVLAQEVEAVIPELVKEVDGLNGREGFKAVDYNKLVPVLIESIKELKFEIDELKKNQN